MGTTLAAEQQKNVDFLRKKSKQIMRRDKTKNDIKTVVTEWDMIMN